MPVVLLKWQNYQIVSEKLLLDEVGNTTAAIGKGFAIGASALAALALISAYIEKVSLGNEDFILRINDPVVLSGMFLGAIFPYLVSSITMTAVGDAAFDMIVEVRRQFKEIPGIMEGTGKPEYDKCVDISTKASLKEMMLPGLITIVSPITIVLITILQKVIHDRDTRLWFAGLIIVAANAGGAWDNAKKYVEKGNLGGKGTDTHAATVVGDTVGDPFKDTSGPAMNILINVMAIVSLVIAPLLV